MRSDRRLTRFWPTSLFVALFLACATSSARADAGKDAFDSQCASCHTLDGRSTPSGPSLKGVVWRKIAGLRDFRYSAGLKATVGDWTPARLDAYLSNSQAFAPGTDMFWDVHDVALRRAIVDFLQKAR